MHQEDINWYGNHGENCGNYMNLGGSKDYIPVLLCCFVLFFISNLFSISYATEAPITRQSVVDEPLDWVNVAGNTVKAEGDPATDIVEVTYVTNDKSFNSTLWLMFPFKERPVEYSVVNYGILIDSDFDVHTGVNGIDYQLEIRWDNKTNTWTRTLTEWPAMAIGAKVLEETKNFTGFSGDHLYYVSIPLELKDILYPNKFRAIYYAESKKEAGPLITDFTKFIAVPLPEIKLTTHPESVKLRQGETKTIELIINSSSAPQPGIILYSENIPSRPVVDLNNRNLTIPSDGFASTPVTIKTSSDTQVVPHTITIKANSSFHHLNS